MERLEPQLADSVVEAGRLLAGGGLKAFIATLEPRVHAVRNEQHLVLELRCAPEWGASPHMQDIDVDVPGEFTLVPSAFSWPHAWASIEPPWPLGMTYPAPFLLREARPRVPPTDLVRVLRACGDDLRLRMLRWIVEKPRSTQELAPLIGITESALSKHLHQLAKAGVFEPRREGRYVAVPPAPRPAENSLREPAGLPRFLRVLLRTRARSSPMTRSAARRLSAMRSRASPYRLSPARLVD